MADTAFLQRLKDYDKDHIPEAVMKKIKTYTAMEEFQPAVIEKVSKAATGLCKWVRAMEIYDRVAKVVEPKRIALKEAEENLAVMMAALSEKQAALKEINDKIAKLERTIEPMYQVNVPPLPALLSRYVSFLLHLRALSFVLIRAPDVIRSPLISTHWVGSSICSCSP